MNKFNYFLGLCLPLLFTAYSLGFVDNNDPGDLIKIIDEFGGLCPKVDFRICSRLFETYVRMGNKRAKKVTGKGSKLILDKFKCCGASSVFKCARDQIKKCVSHEIQYDLGKRLEDKAQILEQGKCSRYKTRRDVCNSNAEIPIDYSLVETTHPGPTSTLALNMNAPQTAKLISKSSQGEINNMDPDKLIEIIDQFGRSCTNQQADFMRCTGAFRSYKIIGNRKAAKEKGEAKQMTIDKIKCCGASSVINCARGVIKKCFSPEVQNELGLKLEGNAKLLEQGKCTKYKYGSAECSTDGTKPKNVVLFAPLTKDESQLTLGNNTLPLTQNKSGSQSETDISQMAKSNNVSQTSSNKNTTTLVLASNKLTLILLIITYLSNKLF